MNKDYLAILDACVLAGGGLRDTLLRLAETPRLYIPRWSDDIIAETVSTLQTKFGKSVEKTDHLQAEMRKAFPEAWVTGYKHLEACLGVEQKDRHVLAAAIRCCAQTIVTFNLKHFPPQALEVYDIEAVHPDQFLVNQFYLDTALVTKRFVEQASCIGRSPEEQLRCFHRAKSLPLFTQTLADALVVDIAIDCD